MWALIIWLVLLVIFYSVSVWMEKKAAMRGTHRNPLSGVADKALRLFFLFILMSPPCYFFPKICIPITLLYLPTYIDNGEKTGKRVFPWLRKFFFWKWVKSYFSLNVKAPYGKLDKTKQYVVGVHPHGFLPVGTMINMLTDVSNIKEEVLNGVELRTLAASFCFYVPAYRDLLLSGGVLDAARYNAANALRQGYSLALVPGGATEALYAQPGKHILVLKKRTGFIKLAMENGADLVPVYSFGEVECYNQLAGTFPWVKPIQAKFQRIFGLSCPLVTNIIPKRSKITTVFGKAIPVKKTEKPTSEEVQEVLTTYIQAVETLFKEQAPNYIDNPKERVLTIL